jgi:peptide/nickel transport system substrate-binding protein
MSRMSARVPSVIAGSTLALVFALTCSTVAAAPKQLVVSQAADAVTLDPHMHSQAETMNVLLNVYDPLVDFSEKFEPVPNLATSWKQLDPVTWRFVLRKGVTFHNGEPFTARAVKFSFDRLVDPNQKAPMGTRLTALKEVRVVDDYTVDIVTKEPYAPLLYIISLYLQIAPPDAVKQLGDTKFGLTGVGTGPYRVVSWVRDQELVLEANLKYWRGAPRVQRVVYRPVPEDSARVAALQTGESDIVASVPPERWKDVQQDKATRMSARTGTMVYIGLDTYHPPFNDRRVRLALNHAIDVDTIIKKILLGTADRMNGPFFKTALGYDKSIQPYRYDPVAAKKLLAEAGYPNGFETVLSALPAQEGASNLMEVAETVAYQLGQIGVKVRIDTLEPATAFQRYRNREFKMYFFTWPENPEPDRYLYTLFHSQARGYYYKNAEADRLLDQGRKTFNVNERRKVYEALHRMLYEDAPWVFLYTQKTGFGIRQRVKWEAPWDGIIRIIDADVGG